MSHKLAFTAALCGELLDDVEQKISRRSKRSELLREAARIYESASSQTYDAIIRLKGEEAADHIVKVTQACGFLDMRDRLGMMLALGRKIKKGTGYDPVFRISRKLAKHFGSRQRNYDHILGILTNENTPETKN